MRHFFILYAMHCAAHIKNFMLLIRRIICLWRLMRRVCVCWVKIPAIIYPPYRDKKGTVNNAFAGIFTQINNVSIYHTKNSIAMQPIQMAYLLSSPRTARNQHHCCIYTEKNQ